MEKIRKHEILIAKKDQFIFFLDEVMNCMYFK